VRDITFLAKPPAVLFWEKMRGYLGTATAVSRYRRQVNNIRDCGGY